MISRRALLAALPGVALLTRLNPKPLAVGDVITIPVVYLREPAPLILPAEWDDSRLQVGDIVTIKGFEGSFRIVAYATTANDAA
jgi:hypothetical protein